MVSPQCVSSRSHGLHGAWQRAGRGGYGEKNGPAKPCEGWSDPQTSWLEEETPTATSFPQGAHAILEQGGFLAVRDEKMLDRFCLAKSAIKPAINQNSQSQPSKRLLPSVDSRERRKDIRPTFCPTFCQLRATCFSREYEQKYFPIYEIIIAD